MNLRVAAVLAALIQGVIYFDADGNLLASATGAKLTVDMQIPAGHKTQLNVFGTGNIISASWATAATDIIVQIKNLKKAARKETGYPLAHAFYGENVLDYFLTNTKLKELINRNASYQTAFSKGEIADGFLGLKWWPIEQAFFKDQDGSYQDLAAATQIVFTPEPDNSWWELMEGSYVIPTSLGNLASDMNSALSNLTEVTGMFSYAKVLDDPATIKQLAGDTFLPVVKVPKAVYNATVAF
jgi:hypothetical protein